MRPEQPSRGTGYKREMWYSICSAHVQRDPECHLCNVGSWVNVRKNVLTAHLHDNYYEKWFKWANYDKQGNRKELKFEEYDSTGTH